MFLYPKVVVSYRQLGEEFVALGVASWHGHPSLMPRSHRHSEVELNFIEEGSIRYLFGGDMVLVEAGRLMLFWAAVPHQLVEVDENARFVWLTIPLSLFLQWQLPKALIDHVLSIQPVLSPGRVEVPSDRSLFRQWHEDLAAGVEERRNIVLLEVEARLRRLALSVNEADGQILDAEAAQEQLSRSALGKAEQMAHFIARHYRESLRVADIARTVDLHPNYAMYVFRQTFGMGLVEYLTRYRVAQAQRLLATTDDSVVDIALDAGFGSVSRFYAAFKKLCRLSPRKYRQSLRSLP